MAPALLGARIYADRTLPWQYALFTAGVAAIVIGVARGRFGVAAAGGVAVNLAAWWFIALLAAGIASAGPRARRIEIHSRSLLLNQNA
jgi:hypothetical protein